MCGIAGWVDFERDLALEAPTLRAMTGTMAPRGPDEENVWLSHRVGLGVRRLSVVDHAGGQQPMLARDDGSVIAALAYTGEIFNCSELRTELEAQGHCFATRSDTEVVLHAYLQWGTNCAPRLNGMFAFAVWDAQAERLVLIRDRVGIYPMNYMRLSTGLLFGSEQKALLAHPLVSPVATMDDLRELMSSAGSPDYAGYADMQALPPGHSLTATRQGLRLERYWSFTPQEHVDDRRTTIRTIRDLLEDIVARQVIADVPVATMLSGGLDSSAITALVAREIARHRGDRLPTFAVTFTGHDKHFQPLEGIRSTPDAPYAEAVARHLGCQHTAVELDTPQLTDPVNRGNVLRARDLPTPWGDLYTSLYLLSREVRRHATVAITGDAADELFGGYHWAHTPRLQSAGTFPWVAATMECPPSDRSSPDALLRADLRDDLALDEYRADHYATAIAEVEHLPGASPDERRAREISYLDLTRYLRIIIDRKDRMGMAAALEGRVPFCDHRLLEYVYNVPWPMKSFDGKEKSLLRAAVSDLLPTPVLERQKAGYPITEDPAYEVSLRAQLREIISTEAPVRPMLDEVAISAFLDDPYAAHSEPISRSSVEMVLNLNDWLSSYGVTIRV